MAGSRHKANRRERGEEEYNEQILCTVVLLLD